MLKLNVCPRCGGTVLIDRDQYGWYKKCLNCGYEHDFQQVVKDWKSVKVGVKVIGDV